MDRNEVTLVGRLPEAVRIRALQSGSTLGSWRMIVRRQSRGRGTRVDTIPCVSFEPEVTRAAADWLPDDMIEVMGSLRRRWWGSDGAKSSGYEVEVRSVRRLERRSAAVPIGDCGPRLPVPTPPRPVHSLVQAKAGVAGEGRTPGHLGSGPLHAVDGNAPVSVRRQVETPSLDDHS